MTEKQKKTKTKEPDSMAPFAKKYIEKNENEFF